MFYTNENRCTACELGMDETKIHTNNVTDIIPTVTPDILVVMAEAPYDTKFCQLQSSVMMTQIYNMIHEIYPDKTIAMTSLVHCYTSNTIKISCIKTCRELHFNKLMQQIAPQKILFLGAVAAKAVTGIRTSINRGNIIQTLYGEAVVAGTYAEVTYNSLTQKQFKEDIQALYNKSAKTFDISKFNIHIAKTQDDIYDFFNILNKQDMLYFDIEGSTLPYSNSLTIPHKLISASFTYQDNEAYVFPLETLIPMYEDKETLDYALQAVKALCENNARKTCHYGKYDAKYIRFTHGMRLINYTDDTYVKSYLYHEKEAHGLKDLTNIYQPDMFEYDRLLDEYKAAHPECNPKRGGSYYYIPNEILVPYNGMDTIATYRYDKRITPILAQNPALVELQYRILMPAWNEYLEIEHVGWRLDREGLEKEGARLQNIITSYTAAIYEAACAKHVSCDVNFDAPQDIAKFLVNMGELKPEQLRTTASGALTSDEKDIIYLINNGSTLAKNINIVRKASSMYSKYVKGFLHELDANDRYHPEFNLAKTDTGRTSEKRIQTITKKYRKFFLGDTLLFECDFSQLEIRLMACVARVKLMLEIYERKGDIHKLTASAARYIKEDMNFLMEICASGNPDLIIKTLMDFFNLLDKGLAKSLRQQAKSLNFSFLYRAYYLSVVQRINDNTNKNIKDIILALDGEKNPEKITKLQEELEQAKKSFVTDEEGKVFDSAFFTLYPEIKDYHAKCEYEVKRTGAIVSPMGRVKHLPDAQLDPTDANLARISHALNASTNHPIQSLGADCKLYCLCKIQKAIREAKIQANVVGEVHDSTNSGVRCHRGDAIQMFHILKNNMNIAKGEFTWALIDIPSDLKLGFNWGDCDELKDEDELITWLDKKDIK